MQPKADDYKLRKQALELAKRNRMSPSQAYALLQLKVHAKASKMKLHYRRKNNGDLIVRATYEKPYIISRKLKLKGLPVKAKEINGK